MAESFRVAERLAEALASDPALAEAAGAMPRVFLHGIDPELAGDGRPIVCVAVGDETHPVRGDAEFDIVIAIAIDASAQGRGNAAVSAEDPCGVFRTGDARTLEAFADAALAAAMSAEPGAELTGAETEFDASSLPLHTAAITLSYRQIKTF